MYTCTLPGPEKYYPNYHDYVIFFNEDDIQLQIQVHPPLPRNRQVLQGLILHFLTHMTQGPARLVIHRSFQQADRNTTLSLLF